MKNPCVCGLGVLLMVAGASCHPLFAQSDSEKVLLEPGEKPGEEQVVEDFSDEITVTGQQQERPLQRTIESVTVVSGAELEAGTIRDLYDLVAVTPNVSQAQGFKGFSIRGVNQRGLGSGSGLLVSVRVDGATLQNDESTFFGPYGAWDLERVEIFRGPQSTQQGRNALAGAIVLRGADPTYEQEVKGRLTLGGLGTRQVSVAVNVPLAADKAALRLSVDQRESDGWVDNPTRGQDNYDFRESLTARGKLRFDPTERFGGMLTFSYTDSKGGEDIVARDSFPRRRLNLSDERAEEGSVHEITHLELSYELTDEWAFESSSSLYAHEYLRIEDGDMSPAPGNLLRIDQDDDGLSQQFRFVYSGKNGLKGVAGIYYADLDDTNVAVATLPGAVLGLPPFLTVTGRQARTVTTKNLAVFGEFDLEFGDRWTLTAGARFDDEKRTENTIQSSTIDPPVISLPTVPPTLLDSEYDAFLPKVAVTYDWTDNAATSLSVQQGYRAGGRSQSLLSQQLSDFDPEFTTNYEFALRSVFPARGLRFNANLFYVDWQDQQVEVRTALDLEFDTIVVNAGSSKLSGLEAQLDYQASESLDVFVAAGWVETEFTRFVDGNQDFSGNEFPYAPSWSLTVGGDWRAGQRWRLAGSVATQGGFFSDQDNGPRLEVDGRTLVNAKLSYALEKSTVAIFARNLLDEDYVLEALPGGVRVGEPQVLGVEWTFSL